VEMGFNLRRLKEREPTANRKPRRGRYGGKRKIHMGIGSAGAEKRKVFQPFKEGRDISKGNGKGLSRREEATRTIGEGARKERHGLLKRKKNKAEAHPEGKRGRKGARGRGKKMKAGRYRADPTRGELKKNNNEQMMRREPQRQLVKRRKS